MKRGIYRSLNTIVDSGLQPEEFDTVIDHLALIQHPLDLRDAFFLTHKECQYVYKYRH